MKSQIFLSLLNKILHMSVCTNTTPQFNRKTDPGEMMGGSESVTLQVTPLESQEWGRGGGAAQTG